MPHTDGAVDTRTRIQDVALELFTTYGYDKASLREIAERLGVTKATLYYHFKSKDDIVQSLVDDLLDAIDDVVEWSRTQTPSPQTRRELVERYSAVIRSHGVALMRFIMENQPAMREHRAGEAIRTRMSELFDFLADPSDPLTSRMCGRLALFALHGGPAIMGDTDASDDEVFDAACAAALTMLPDTETDRREPVNGNAARIMP